MASPCGTNCSYTVTFEGPYVECKSMTTLSNINYSTQNGTIYPYESYSTHTGQRSAPAQASLVQLVYNGTYSLDQFNATTLTPISMNRTTSPSTATPYYPFTTSSLLVQQNNTICSPGRASYIVNNTFENNVQKMVVSMEPIDRLINLALPTHNSIVLVPGFCNGTGFGLGTTPANWSTDALNFYRDNNMMAILDATMGWV